MKNLHFKAVIFSFFLVFSGNLWGDDVYIIPFAPVSSTILAQGSAFTASARGTDALWTNPAGLARKAKNILTFLDVQGDFYITPSQINGLIGRINDNAFANLDVTAPAAFDTVNFLQNLLQTNGFGLNTNFTVFGLVVNGLGLGLSSTVDVYARGKTLTGTTAVVEGVVGGVIGFAYPFALGPMKLYFGVDVRPFYRVYSTSTVMDLLTALGSGSFDSYFTSATAGLAPGFAIDVGAIGEIADWSFGLSLRDSGTPIKYNEYSLEYIRTNWSKLSAGTPSVDTYITPLTLSLGTAWEPKLGPFSDVVVPKVSLDVTVPFKGSRTPSWYTWIHLGTEVTILNYLSLRAGMNQGYLTGGFGVSLYLWEANVAIYSQELGQYAGEKRRTAVSVESKFKF
ncbi:MAG: hypothetical protein A2Z96_03800 [Spirochaetes bacterium GWB1_48_6]|nr:MAG: hypothetical protein A2Z96_03800 [Spirochaetes bacterium GWB1_48_6]